MISDHNLGTNGGAPFAVLAPLTGLSDHALRRLAHRWGADLVVTEMVAAREYVRGHEAARLKAEGQGITPHVVQLVGRDPASMAEAARLAEDAGADMIDINMGCPAKRVASGRLAGSALMREPELALRLIAAVVAATRRPVTLKMRLGWDDTCRNADELARNAADAGIRAVTVHGRTRQQFYKGTADWAAIAEVVEAVKIPVTANGDVASIADARRCLVASGAAGVMIGRAAIGQPWLVGSVSAALRGCPVPDPSPVERAVIAVEHYESLLSLYGRAIGTRCARKHLAAYAERARSDGFWVDDDDRRTLVTSEEPKAVIACLNRVFVEPLRRVA